MSGIMKSLRTGADRAAFETARLVRMQREQFRIKAQEDQKRELVLNLGETVWQMYTDQQVSEPRLVTICQQIQTMVQQIQELEKTLEKIKQEQPPEPPKCGACGQELSADNTFCPACGAKVTVAPAPQPTATIAAQSCPQCGRALRPGSTFCGGCGHRLTVSSP